MMTIHIEDLTFDVIIGLLDFERVTPQKVIVNLQASYIYDHDKFINYADIVEIIKDKLTTERYKLLEDALLGLRDIISTTYPDIQTLEIKISKPDILSECIVSLSANWNI